MRAIKYTIIGLVILLVILLAFGASDYRNLRKAQIISAHQLWVQNVVKDHGTLNASDVSIIRPWMTFDYIDRLFALPPGYLQTSLSINDPQYPKLSVSGYAKYSHQLSAAVVNGIENAIRSYY